MVQGINFCSVCLLAEDETWNPKADKTEVK